MTSIEDKLTTTKEGSTEDKPQESKKKISLKPWTQTLLYSGAVAGSAYIAHNAQAEHALTQIQLGILDTCYAVIWLAFSLGPIKECYQQLLGKRS